MNMPLMLKYLCQYLGLSRNQFTDERAQCQNLFDIVLVVRKQWELFAGGEDTLPAALDIFLNNRNLGFLCTHNHLGYSPIDGCSLAQTPVRLQHPNTKFLYDIEVEHGNSG